MKKNRIIAGLSAIMMGATMMAGTAMSAYAADVKDSSNTVIGDCRFYRYKNNAWSVVPYGMDDGNIVNAQMQSDGSIKLYFDYATYHVLGFIPLTGGVASVSGTGVTQGPDANNDGCMDWAIVPVDTEVTLTVCDEDGNTNIAWGLMPNPITVKLVYTANS